MGCFLFATTNFYIIISNMKHYFLLAAILLLASNIALPVAALAATGDNISRSFSTSSDLEPGSIVATSASDATEVELASTENQSRLTGVVVAQDSSIVAVDPDNTMVQVASSGQVQVLVSDVNGDIKSGDKIAISPFAGVGMKALVNGHIVGQAVTDFANEDEAAIERTTRDKNGDSRTIKVGYVAVNLALGYDGTVSDEEKASGLQAFVRSLTGRTISTPRIIVSIIIMVLTVIVIAVLVYAAIYGSIISIGRNPLAQDSILKALSYALLIAAGAVITALVLIYLLLR
jgi:hypothetical protein